MKLHRIRYLFFAFLVFGVASACQLSGSKAPTAFTFPTPDFTGTAIYWSVATSLAPSRLSEGSNYPVGHTVAIAYVNAHTCSHRYTGEYGYIGPNSYFTTDSHISASVPFRG